MLARFTLGLALGMVTVGIANAQSGNKPAAQGYIPNTPSNYNQDKQLKALEPPPPPPQVFQDVHRQYQEQQQKGNVGK